MAPPNHRPRPEEQPPTRVPDVDGGSDKPLLRSLLKKPLIPPRTSSRRALHRSQSSENLKKKVAIAASPPTLLRRASSLSLPPEESSPSPSSSQSSSTSTPDPLGPPDLDPATTSSDRYPAPQVIRLPRPRPRPHPQTAVQLTLATPTIVVHKDGNPFDLATALEDPRVRHAGADIIPPPDEAAAPPPSAAAAATATPMKNTGKPAGARHTAKGRLSGRVPRKPSVHVGWKSDYLIATLPEDDIGEFAGRRSSSLSDLQAAAAGGKHWKSVKGRRATPWVHNIGVGATWDEGIGTGGRGGMEPAFPALKRLSDASVGSVESGREVWFDAMEEHEA
ncbi:hypothetical protein DRE_04038 [Drechslerella stenobrocha 248]|uniref:Uncharacterized protein n=1 Tax=Drechslerella stenobrocha 248 TaxID=1043628 RepID=W7I3L3_9PEZI|nr:hypothetical protein DRE_04038 [Drechslerella stenobrocha 248]